MIRSGHILQLEGDLAVLAAISPSSCGLEAGSCGLEAGSGVAAGPLQQV